MLSTLMPLIVICGYPCSGKTRRAEELKVYFEQNCDKKVYIVGDGALDVDRNTVYAGKLAKLSQFSRSDVIRQFRRVVC